MTAHRLKILPLLLCMCCICCSCTSVREGRLVIEVADSLRVNEGVTCDDSLALANAYTTFGHWRLIYPDDYARSCYYYGRMLRNRNDQVAAMQAFIRGKRAPYVQRFIPLPHFTDYHILGRIYSNMGTMCHYIENFSLAYEMYDASATCFQNAHDTTAYYYALNAMAFELAEQNLHDETLSLLYKIEQECSNPHVITKTWETKALLYKNIELYDSTIYCVRQLQSKANRDPAGYVMIAQSFWHLQQYDSAVYYANCLMKHPYAADKDKYNMLYILAYSDSSAGMKEVLVRTEERSDIDRYNIDPITQLHTQAVDILLQDLDRNIPRHYIILFVVGLCLIGVVSIYSIHIIKKRHFLSQRAIENERIKVEMNLSAQRQALYEETIHEKEIQADLQHINEVLRQENEEIKLQYSAHREQFLQEIEANCEAIRHSHDWKKEVHWKNFEEMCEFTNRHFFMLANKLKATGKLDEKEIRLCFLILLDMHKNKEQANLLYYGQTGIGTYKYRLSRKFNLYSKDLRKFVLEMAVSGTH